MSPPAGLVNVALCDGDADQAGQRVFVCLEVVEQKFGVFCVGLSALEDADMADADGVM